MEDERVVKQTQDTKWALNLASPPQIRTSAIPGRYAFKRTCGTAPTAHRAN
ncbi:hypothetical protein OG520_38640 [Streptomyces sp. NBC_00984]|uniref:hypothetical protein n=1 Tax=Streptomyces sp. NBC_00984 TaxID=2903700 RepID=UPI00386AE893|nr:hypothetical protein OG520_38640 [Streptomyces sp. NBC_00984]